MSKKFIICMIFLSIIAIIGLLFFLSTIFLTLGIPVESQILLLIIVLEIGL
jgi:hypothetical protein